MHKLQLILTFIIKNSYRKNLKKQVRADSDEFRAYIRSEEDEAFSEIEETTADKA